MSAAALIILFLLSAEVYAQKSSNIKILNEEKLDSLIQNRNGKPLLLNFWATWCIPCREEFPALLKLYSEKGSKIDFAGISLDFQEEVNTKILPFVKKMKITFPIFVNGFRKDEHLINKMSGEWSGALPATFTFSSSGKPIHFIEGGRDYEYFNKIISELINEE